MPTEIDQTVPTKAIPRPDIKVEVKKRDLYEFTIPAGDNIVLGAVTHHYEWPEVKVITVETESWFFGRKDLVTRDLEGTYHVYKGDHGPFAQPPAVPEGEVHITDLLIPSRLALRFFGATG